MNDCLVKTLKKGMNDEALSLYDGFEVEIEPGEFILWTELPNGVVVEWDNEVDTINLWSAVIHSPYTHIYASGNADKWNGTLTQKTKFTFRKALYVNKQFRYMKGSITCGKDYLQRMFKYGVLAEFYGENVFYADGETINISDTKGQQLKRFYVFSRSTLYVKGDVKDFDAQVICTNIGLIGQGGVDGTLESLVEGLCRNGKVGNNLTVDFRNTAVTFNGVRISTTLYNNGFVLTFSSTGATVNHNNTTIATYTKSSGTWTYN